MPKNDAVIHGSIEGTAVDGQGRDTMSEQKLKQSLKELCREIESLDVGDPAVKERLFILVRNIELSMASPEARQQRHDLVRELQAALKTFEAAHPAMTGILNEMINALVNLGI
jgi:hypothetical protein